TGVTVTDTVEGSISTPVTLVSGDTNNDHILQTTETWTYSASYTLTQSDLDQGDTIDNVAVVDTSQAAPESDDAHVPVTQSPDLSIDKTAAVADGAADEVGDVINYTIVVHTPRNTDLTGVTVTDTVEGSISTPVTLVSGDTNND